MANSSLAPHDAPERSEDDNAFGSRPGGELLVERREREMFAQRQIQIGGIVSRKTVLDRKPRDRHPVAGAGAAQRNHREPFERDIDCRFRNSGSSHGRDEQTARLVPKKIWGDSVFRLHPHCKSVRDFGAFVRQQPAGRDGGVDDECHQ